MPQNYIFEHCPLDQHLIQLGSNYGRLQYLNVLEASRRSEFTWARSTSAQTTPAHRSRFCSPGATAASPPSLQLTRQPTNSTAPSSTPVSPTFSPSSLRSTPPTLPAGAVLPNPARSGNPTPVSLDSSSLMLNIRALSDMLKVNEDENLWPKIFLMSPNGTLVAYSQPSNTKELRDQAALISMAWKDQEAEARASLAQPDTADTGAGSVVSPGALETLTIEKDNMNLIVRAIQPRLLLVMRGGAPPGRKKDFKMTPEVRGAPRYPTGDPILQAGAQSARASPVGSPGRLSTSQSSTLSQRDRDILGGVLHIQRKKVDALTNEIRKDFDAKGFVMPNDAALQ